MALVRNNVEGLAYLASCLGELRERIGGGETALRQQLLFQVSDSWSDAQYEAFREALLSELNVIRRVNNDALMELEALAQRLRARLEDYLGSGSGGAALAQPSSPSIECGEQVTRLLAGGDISALIDFFRRQPFTKEAYEALLAGLRSASPDVVLTALIAFREICFPTFLRAGDQPVPLGAADAALPALRALLSSKDPSVRDLAGAIIAQLEPEDGDAFIEWIISIDVTLQLIGIQIAGSVRRETAPVREALSRAARGSSPPGSIGAVDALARFGSTESRAVLRELQLAGTPGVARRAGTALAQREWRDRGAAAANAALSASDRGTPSAESEERLASAGALLLAAVGQDRPAVAALPAVQRAMRPDATPEAWMAARATLGQRIAAAPPSVPDAPASAPVVPANAGFAPAGPASAGGRQAEVFGTPRIMTLDGARSGDAAQPPPSVAMSVMAAALRDPAVMASMASASNPMVRAGALCAAAVQTHSTAPEQQLAAATAAVEAASATNDRPLRAVAHLTRAAAETRCGRAREALAAYAAADAEASAMSVASASAWAQPFHEAILLGRASACSGLRTPTAIQKAIELLIEALLVLLRLLGAVLDWPNLFAGIFTALLGNALHDLWSALKSCWVSATRR
jgi:hypothetical protein